MLQSCVFVGNYIKFINDVNFLFEESNILMYTFSDKYNSLLLENDCSDYGDKISFDISELLDMKTKVSIIILNNLAKMLVAMSDNIHNSYYKKLLYKLKCIMDYIRNKLHLHSRILSDSVIDTLNFINKVDYKDYNTIYKSYNNFYIYKVLISDVVKCIKYVCCELVSVILNFSECRSYIFSCDTLASLVNDLIGDNVINFMTNSDNLTMSVDFNGRYNTQKFIADINAQKEYFEEYYIDSVS